MERVEDRISALVCREADPLLLHKLDISEVDLAVALSERWTQNPEPGVGRVLLETVAGMGANQELWFLRKLREAGLTTSEAVQLRLARSSRVGTTRVLAELPGLTRPVRDRLLAHRDPATRDTVLGRCDLSMEEMMGQAWTVSSEQSCAWARSNPVFARWLIENALGNTPGEPGTAPAAQRDLRSWPAFVAEAMPVRMDPWLGAWMLAAVRTSDPRWSHVQARAVARFVHRFFETRDDLMEEEAELGFAVLEAIVEQAETTRAHSSWNMPVAVREVWQRCVKSHENHRIPFENGCREWDVLCEPRLLDVALRTRGAWRQAALRSALLTGERLTACIEATIEHEAHDELAAVALNVNLTEADAQRLLAAGAPVLAMLCAPLSDDMRSQLLETRPELLELLADLLEHEEEPRHIHLEEDTMAGERTEDLVARHVRAAEAWCTRAVCGPVVSRRPGTAEFWGPSSHWARYAQSCAQLHPELHDAVLRQLTRFDLVSASTAAALEERVREALERNNCTAQFAAMLPSWKLPVLALAETAGRL